MQNAVGGADLRVCPLFGIYDYKFNTVFYRTSKGITYECRLLMYR
jgi:hypothetical protein